MSGREFHWKWNGEDYAVRIETKGPHGTLTRAGQSTEFLIEDKDDRSARLTIGGRHFELFFAREGNSVAVWCGGTIYRLQAALKTASRHAAETAAPGEVRAPMPGKVIRIEAALHAVVTDRQPVILLESMKMESAVHAPRAGRVAQILVQPGQIVQTAELLMVIE